jgi:hypothetical protein
LFEADIPDLCADRIDYSLREFPLAMVKKCFFDLIVFQNKIVFKTKKTAKLFAENFLLRQKNHWGGYEAVTRYKIFSDVLKFALDDKIIDFNDFMNTEDYILKKIDTSSNKKIKRYLNTLKKKNLDHLPLSHKRYWKKFRYVDPLFISKGILLRYVDEKFKKSIKQRRKQNKQGIRIGLVDQPLVIPAHAGIHFNLQQAFIEIFQNRKEGGTKFFGNFFSFFSILQAKQ